MYSIDFDPVGQDCLDRNTTPPDPGANGVADPAAGASGPGASAGIEAIPPPPHEQQAAFLRAILVPDIGCAEVRVFTKSKLDRNGWIVPDPQYGGTLASWFTQANEIANEASRLKGVSAYITANPVHPDLLARGCNKLAKQKDTTTNEDILVLRNLLIDCDPERRKGISATEAERRGALECRDRILADHPEIAESSIWACSGNGGFDPGQAFDLPNDSPEMSMLPC